MRGWLVALVLGLPCVLAGPAARAEDAAKAPPSPARQAQQERMRQCNAESGQQALKGEARQGFMRECLGKRRADAAPAVTNGPALATAVTTYPSESAAQAGCGDDAVVWGSSDSRVFHLRDSRFYGKTQHGSYLCRMQAEMGGYRAAR